MKIELESFIIECDKEISYMPVIVSTLENDTIKILDFFKLKKLSKKKRVIIFTDREKYKEHLLPHVSKFQEWMCGDTYDGNINLLEINETRKSEKHKNMDIDKFVKGILHEFVHSCEQELKIYPNKATWYWEALATNLSGQDYKEIDLKDCDFEKLKIDFNNTERAYSYAYTLGKFMLNNYSQDKLLEYVKNSNLLKEDADKIFELAKQSQIKNKH